MTALATVEIVGLNTTAFRAAVAVVRAQQVEDLRNHVVRPQPLPECWTIGKELWGIKVANVPLELAVRLTSAAQT